MRTRPSTDLRRAISRQAWLANRARNAIHRPAFIGAISVAAFVLAIVSMIVVPRGSKPAAIASAPRPDTIGLLANFGAGRIRVQQADSALAGARQAAAVKAQQRFADSLAAVRLMDSLGMNPAATMDSLTQTIATLDQLLARAEQAPLPASYRAVAEMPSVRNDTRVRALVDTLNAVESQREGFGSVGGVNPIFVALTTRVNEIGRRIVTIAAQTRGTAAMELASLQPMPVDSEATSVIDTVSLVAGRDSAIAAMRSVEARLTERREQSLAMDLQEERARERANAVAPPLALLAAAFVLSAVIGFGTAFFRELRRPRIADAQEIERFLGARVLSSVETRMPSAERGRREADRLAPPYFDPGAEGYQLAYLGLATDHPALLTVAVTGDDPAIAAVVACNLAAVASDEARTTLVIDLDPRCNASAMLRARIAPGIAELTRGDREWPDVTQAAQVGRDRTVDLVARGAGGLEVRAVVELLERDGDRLARYYDAVVVLTTPEQILGGLSKALPSRELIYCAQPGLTPLREMRSELEQLAAAGAELRGIVLWEAERPLLPTPKELMGRRAKVDAEPQTAAAG